MPQIRGLERLELALRKVLGEQGFDDQIRVLVENQKWYAPELPITEVFRLWVYENICIGDDPLWIFQPIRAGERKYLCDHLGIDRSDIVGKTPRELANAILEASELPVMIAVGVQTTIASWQEIIRLAENNEDERAAVISRQRAERILRKILHFYCSSGYGTTFIDILENPGSLKLPAVLVEALSAASDERVSKVVELLTVDGWADLGFLALALRKYSARLETSALLHPSGKLLILFTQQDYDSFSKLSSSLQSYAHDKPSKLASRRGELEEAVRGIVDSIERMVARQVVPEDLLVLATGSTFLGAAFKGLHESGKIRCLTVEETQILPRLGRRVMVVTTADRDYARCLCVESPWPVD
jgi:hypothetical protein